MDVNELGERERDPFVVDANEAITFYSCDSPNSLDSLVNATRFKPEMSHQIFGEEEAIYGYKDLSVKLYFSADHLDFAFDWEFSTKAEPTAASDAQPENIDTKIRESVPFSLTEGGPSGLKEAMNRREPFQPPGELVHNFSKDSSRFEIYRVTKENRPEAFSEYFNRVQYFSLWFIDAANFIDPLDDRWVFFLVYDVQQSSTGQSYSFVGYTSVYEYYGYPENVRPRIAHMLVLPPYQHRGSGFQMFQTIYRHFLSNSMVIDITVEDPSEAFQGLRDFVDCLNIAQLDAFSSGSVQRGFTDEMAKQAKQRLKVNRRQARRVYEIMRLKYTNTEDQDAYRAYRLDVKKRLNAPFYKRPAELARLQATLSEEELALTLSRDQRLECLQKQFEETLGQYRQTLDRISTVADRFQPLQLPALVPTMNGH